MPPAERLINLTKRDVMLVSQPQSAAEGSAEAPLVCVPPDGHFARVDDSAARLHEHLLNTDSRVFRLTRLRRLGRLVDLPPPATRIPQELAVGLGVQLGQRSWERRPGQQWPQQVYPVLHAGDHLVVPDVRLGADSVPGQRPSGG